MPQALKKNCIKEHVVIATGGGILLDPRNCELLNKNCLIINLEAKIGTIYGRLFDNKYKSGSSAIRPLLSGEDPLERIRELKSSRQLMYTENADWTIHTDNSTINEVSGQIANIWNTSNRTHKDESTETTGAAAIINTAGGIYPVFIQPGLIVETGKKLRQFGFSGKVVVISDSNVYALYGEKCLQSIEEAGFKTFHFVVPAGETSKSHTEAIKIYDFLIENRIERNDVIVALGGGMVGDLAGIFHFEVTGEDADTPAVRLAYDPEGSPDSDLVMIGELTAEVPILAQVAGIPTVGFGPGRGLLTLKYFAFIFMPWLTEDKDLI